MNQEDKELLFKDLCTRLPYGVKVETPYNKTCHNSAKVIGVVKRAGIFKNIEYIDILTDKCTYPIKYIKPYLRPLSSMTEEEAMEYANCGNIIANSPQNNYLIPNPNCVDWLNAYHFDYRGLIPMGLALKALDGMYDLKEK